jgi:hypothetical protein
MKAKSALKQSKRSIGPHLVFVGLTGVAVAFWPNWVTILLLSVSVFSLVVDALNVFYITRKAKNDPDYLESKIE